MHQHCIEKFPAHFCIELLSLLEGENMRAHGRLLHDMSLDMYNSCQHHTLEAIHGVGGSYDSHISGQSVKMNYLTSVRNLYQPLSL